MTLHTLFQDALESTLTSEFIGDFTGSEYQKLLAVMDHLRDDINLAFFQPQQVVNLWEHMRAQGAHAEVELLILRLTQRFVFFLISMDDTSNILKSWEGVICNALNYGGSFAGVDDANTARRPKLAVIQQIVADNPWFMFLLTCDQFHYRLKALAVT